MYWVGKLDLTPMKQIIVKSRQFNNQRLPFHRGTLSTLGSVSLIHANHVLHAICAARINSCNLLPSYVWPLTLTLALLQAMASLRSCSIFCLHHYGCYGRQHFLCQLVFLGRQDGLVLLDCEWRCCHADWGWQMQGLGCHWLWHRWSSGDRGSASF